MILLLSPLPLVPLIFLPRGERFAAEMASARESGVITPGLRTAFADPMVALARRWEAISVGLVIVLMVLKPF